MDIPGTPTEQVFLFALLPLCQKPIHLPVILLQWINTLYNLVAHQIAQRKGFLLLGGKGIITMENAKAA